MKHLIIFSFLFISLTIFSQNRPYKTGDEVEYFDGINWVESKVLQVTEDKCMVYLNNNMSKTKWFSNNDIRLLYPDKVYQVEKIDTIVCKFKVGDTVSIKVDKKVIDSEILKVNPQNLTYLIYVNENKTTVRWIAEKALTKSENKTINKIETKTEVTNSEKIVTYAKGDKVLYNVNGTWIETEIIDIREGLFQIFSDKDKTMTKWVEKSEITK